MMFKKLFLFLNLFFILFFVSFTFSFAQTTFGKILPNCPYKFSNDLMFGDSHEDVVVLQEILNSDKRTLVALSGAGSPGQETGNFGKATREAVKKFQALFIEYIGVADGKFNEKTRTVAQAICEGTLKNNAPLTIVEKPTVQNIKNSNLSPLNISLAANTARMTADAQLRITINTNKEIMKLDTDSMIVDGGSIKEIHKMSKLQYLMIITAEEGSKKISVQIEAEKVEAVDGAINENASNEVVVVITGGGVISSISNAADSLTSTLDNILNQMTSSLTPTTNTNTAANTQTQNTNPTSQPQQSQPPQQNPLAQMLSSMLGGMSGGGQQGGQSGQQNGGGQNINQGADNGGWDQNQNIDANLADIEIPANIDPMCRVNYGIDPGGSCPDVAHLTPLTKKTAMQACTLIKKKISSQSQYRSSSCNRKVGGAQASSHMSGMALDINVNNLTSTERETVFLVFKKNGFNNIGCYRKGSGNVHLDHRGGGPRRWGSDYTRKTYNSSNCPIELIKVFGS